MIIGGFFSFRPALEIHNNTYSYSNSPGLSHYPWNWAGNGLNVFMKTGLGRCLGKG